MENCRNVPIKAMDSEQDYRWQKEAELYKHGGKLTFVPKEATSVSLGLFSQLPNKRS